MPDRIGLLLCGVLLPISSSVERKSWFYVVWTDPLVRACVQWHSYIWHCDPGVTKQHCFLAALHRAPLIFFQGILWICGALHNRLSSFVDVSRRYISISIFAKRCLTRSPFVLCRNVLLLKNYRPINAIVPGSACTHWKITSLCLQSNLRGLMLLQCHLKSAKMSYF